MLHSSLQPRELSARALPVAIPAAGADLPPLLCGGHGRSGPPPQAGEDPDGAPGTGARRLRVVVVEDEFIIMMQIEGLLAAAGAEVVGTAVNADEAMRVAERERPDFLTMDINLSRGADGITAARLIRERFGIPSLFISAYADPQTKDRGEVAAPLGWLAKPVTQHQLDRALEAVRAQLGRGED